jgi:1-acyl-sn-glycerol-3-phosphate acyltransferase
MGPLFHSIANRAAALGMKLLFGGITRIHVLRAENVNRARGFLLAANHISHFDPFIISSVERRKIDWMTMAEFFRNPPLAVFLRAVDAFPADRHRADRKTIRTATNRLKSGHVVGLFPEGGIRDGARSLLEGAPLRPGAAALAQMARVPIVPCVIVGSDRLYSFKAWLPLRRTPIWIAFGNPISHFRELEKLQARERIQCELASAFESLYAELRAKFRLTADDLPHPPRERFGRLVRHAERSRGISLQYPASGSRDSSTSLRFARNDRMRHATATAIDSVICTSMNMLHRRHRLNGSSREEMEHYVARCERLTAEEYYAVVSRSHGIDPINSRGPNDGQTGHSRITTLTWRSPIETQFAENNVASADFFQCEQGISAPTVFLLHSLMSASRVGYRRCAARFNQLCWNACFVHLPYHYSRVPHGYFNGELAITPDLIRNAEALRQGVIELRQLRAALRERGCREFGVLATSYGGWIGALLTMVENDFRFVALMSPIVNVEHAIWQSPAARFLRYELRRANIEPSLIARHFHLSSPLHSQPLCDPARVVFVAGEFDSIAPAAQIEAIQQKWRGSDLLRVRQGHFGYRMMRETIARLVKRGDL